MLGKPFSNLKFTSSFTFDYSSFELVMVILSLSNRSTNFFCIYRHPPNSKNKLSVSLFIEQLPAILEFCYSIGGSVLILGDLIFIFIIIVMMTHMYKKFLAYFMFIIWRNRFMFLLINKVIYWTGLCINQTITFYCQAQLSTNLHLITWLFFAIWM